MKTIEEEWQELTAQLTPEERQDSRKIFYCGVVLGLETGKEFHEGNVQLMVRRTLEAESVLLSPPTTPK